jgi:hypothetical protein
VYTYVPGTLFGFAVINNEGRVVLASRPSLDRTRLLVSSDGASWKTLLDLKGSTGVICVNDANQVLFHNTKGLQRFRIPLLNRLFRRYRTRAYVWDPNLGVVPLDGYVPRGTDMQLAVRDLNNNGCVVGDLVSRTGNRRVAILLEPIPERWGK